MDESAFRTLLTEHLLPMLAGTNLGKTNRSSPKHDLVAYGNPVVLLMKPSHDANYRIQLVRSQAFTSEEKHLVSLFIEEVAEIPDGTDPIRLLDLMSAVPRRVISRFLPGNAGRSTLEQAIRDFESLSSQTYEGHAVVAALGITGSVAHGPIKLRELWREDFSRVLSNGFDSMYLCGSDGRVAGGGRRAAAMQLSRLGLAIKISADGPITGFRKKKAIFSL
jgi:hypothetical protein